MNVAGIRSTYNLFTEAGMHQKAIQILPVAGNNKKQDSLDALKYMTKWYAGAVKKNPNMVDEYYKKSDDYMEENVKIQKVDETFSKIDITSKNTFLESLRTFQMNNPNFLASILNRELSLKFWN